MSALMTTGVVVATKVLPQHKMVLEYLAARQRTTPAAMIREAILINYDLDDPALAEKATSFFGEDVRHVEQKEVTEGTEAV